MLNPSITLLGWLMIAWIALDFAWGFVLDYRNSKGWNKPVPPELADVYDEQLYAKARQYHKEKEKFSLIADTWNTAFTLAFLALHGFAWLHVHVAQVTTQPILQCLLFFGIIAIAADLLNLPFSLYHIFVLEQKYGFNKMTWKTYLTDKVKGYLLGGLLGAGLLSAFAGFYILAGPWFWLYAWILFSVFTLLMTVFYTTLIVPVFNQLRPLEEGPLREQIVAFAAKVRFPVTNIFVIDGSKRSTKANAYFSGLGKKKSIVLYDTLIEQHSTEELVSVLAHEVGHYQQKHIRLSLILSVLQMGLMLFLLSLFIHRVELTQAMGLTTTEPVFHLGLMAFSLLYGPISLLTGLGMNWLSRRNEFEADAYARTSTGTGEYLIQALKKLSAHNLSNLNPDKWYVRFHYSHPPLVERVRQLQAS